jgi:hypothetical protein
VERKLSEWSLIPPGHGEGIQVRLGFACTPPVAHPHSALPACTSGGVRAMSLAFATSQVPVGSSIGSAFRAHPTPGVQVLRYENGEEYKPQ